MRASQVVGTLWNCQILNYNGLLWVKSNGQLKYRPNNYISRAPWKTPYANWPVGSTSHVPNPVWSARLCIPHVVVNNQEGRVERKRRWALAGEGMSQDKGKTQQGIGLVTREPTFGKRLSNFKFEYVRYCKWTFQISDKIRDFVSLVRNFLRDKFGLLL